VKQRLVCGGLIAVTLLLGMALAAPLLADRAGPITIDPSSNNLTLNEGQTFSETITVTVPAGAAASKADVYLLADTTGSMYDPIDAVQDGASDIVAGLMADLPEVDLAFGVGNYKDFPYDPYCFDHQLSLTTTVAVIEAAIDDWNADGGRDGSEGQFFALDQLAGNSDPAGGDIGWRDGAEKIIVLFGDAPGHDPICTAISGLAYDITESSVITKLQESGVALVLISTLTGYDDGLDDNPQEDAWDYSEWCRIGGTSGQATRLAEATNGEHLTGVDSVAIVQTIKDLITSQIVTINSLSLHPTGDAAAFVTSIAPPSYGPLETDEPHVLTFQVGFTGVEPCGESPQAFTGTIDVLTDGAVATQKQLAVNVPACAAAPVYSMQFSGGPGVICPGWNLYYDFTFTNTAPPPTGARLAGPAESITHFVVTTTLPEGTWVHPPEITGTLPSSYDPVEGVITWHTDVISPGESVQGHLILRTYSNLTSDVVTTTFHYSADGWEGDPGVMTAAHQVDRSLCAPTVTPTFTPTNTATPPPPPPEPSKPTDTPTPTPTATQRPLFLPLALRGE